MTEIVDDFESVPQSSQVTVQGVNCCRTKAVNITTVRSSTSYSRCELDPSLEKVLRPGCAPFSWTELLDKVSKVGLVFSDAFSF